MGTLIGILLVFFVFVCAFLVFLVLIQSNKGGSSMGGLMGGGASQTPWGASSADIMTKITRGFALGFLGLTLGLSFLFAKKEEKPPVIPELEAIPMETPKAPANNPGVTPTPEAKPVAPAPAPTPEKKP
ncbi:MAG: preprotein translocase subunit SecG [Leptospiraceae bacterium]|nr:preprotein translocase subunit SecG [Leptospiraceae bacterium]